MLGLQRRIVDSRRPEEVAVAAGVVQVMVEVGPRGDQAVDIPVRDQVCDGQPQPSRAQGAGRAKEDEHLVGEHLLPDAMRGGQVPALERDPLHAREDLLRRQVRLNGEGLHRHAQEVGLLRHAQPAGLKPCATDTSVPQPESVNLSPKPGQAECSSSDPSP